MDRMRENALDNPRAMALSKKTLPAADRFLQRVSGGRLSLSAATGVKVLLLTTTGRRSGAPRVTPLTYVIHDGAYFVVGSNWTQDFDPAWAHNLAADPKAEISVRGKSVPVLASRLSGEEREKVWPTLVELWPLYGYSATKTERELPVFRLQPVQAG
jgi:deazaflavin-dependent oxidoreductase (nitroreductase family)